MLKLLRYTLAAILLAASVGCLGLWLGKISSLTAYVPATWFLQLETEGGAGSIIFNYIEPPRPYIGWRLNVFERSAPWFAHEFERQGSFGTGADFVYFPLWFPALVIALAAVGVMRLGQRFTVRSALIATTVVAALLGMVVAL